MNIEVSGFAKKEYKTLVKDVSSQVINFMKQPSLLEVSYIFVCPHKMKKINKTKRGINKVTDVLSFPATNIKAGEILDLKSPENQFLMIDNEMFHFGDVAICLRRIKSQAKEYKTTTKNELKKIVIHSMLHLMGYDHISDADYVIMNKKEQELDKKIKI